MNGPGCHRDRYPEDTPWAAGITVVVLLAVLVAAAVYAFGAILADVHPILALVINVVAVGGIAPTAWRWRNAPVVRWPLAGAALGILIGWIGLLATA